MISSTLSVSYASLARSSASAPPPPPPSEPEPEGTGVQAAPEKSAESVGHRAKAIVQAAQGQGESLPKNAHGKAASALARGADSAEITASLLGNVEEADETTKVDNPEEPSGIDASEGDLPSPDAAPLPLADLSFSYLSVNLATETSSTDSPSEGQSSSVIQQASLAYINLSIATGPGTSTSAENALDLLT